jgi:hypothetical protein
MRAILDMIDLIDWIDWIDLIDLIGVVTAFSLHLGDGSLSRELSDGFL